MHDRLDHVRGWLRKADSDLNTAKPVVAADGPYDTACHHTQQAVEKYLKALLAFASDNPTPRTHNLEDLFGLCLQALPSWEPPNCVFRPCRPLIPGMSTRGRSEATMG